MNPRLNLKQSKKSATLKHVEQLAEKLEGCNLSETRLGGAYTSIKALSEILEVTSVQAILFTAVLSLNFKNNPVSIGHLSDFLAVPGIKLMQYLDDLSDLQKKRWIRADSDSKGKRSKINEIAYYVPREVLDKLNQKKTDGVADEKSDIYKVLTDVMDLANEFDDDDICHTEMLEDIQRIVDANSELPFNKLLKKKRMTSAEELIFMLVCQRTLLGNPEVDLDKLVKIATGSTYNGKELKRSIARKQNRLNKSGLITVEDGEFRGILLVLLSDNAIRLFLPADKDILIKKSIGNSRLLNGKGIGKVALFFNPEERSSLDRLNTLLSAKEYTKVVGKMKKQGMRCGFTILFHGSPGTGKTEAVRQLARETNREMMHVDLSKTRSKWFGESEKKVAEIFAQYRQLKKRSKLAPILLFNESDGIFGTRSGDIDSTSSQIANTVQNILLEEMENFEGIMVATTNLTGNFDKAFERRFLYKIEFSKPDVETRKQIWLSKIQDLSIDLAEMLSKQFDFSGGQVENVSRKLTIDSVLSDVEPDYNTLAKYCNEELLVKTSSRTLGFQLSNSQKAS